MALLVLASSSCGSNGEDKCAKLQKLVADCYDGFCAANGKSTSFCGCWTQGQDISMQTCSCVPLNLASICQVLNLDNWNGAYDCSAASATVSNICSRGASTGGTQQSYLTETGAVSACMSVLPELGQAP